MSLHVHLVPSLAGAAAGATVTVEGAEAHHAVAVRRLAVGEPVQLTDGAGRLATEAFAFDLGKAGLLRMDDRLGFRIAQPLRVRSGGLGVMLPVGYSYETLATQYAVTEFNLAPEGREIDLEAAYSLAVGGGWLGANAFLRRQPGHVRAAPDDVGGSVRFTLGF